MKTVYLFLSFLALVFAVDLAVTDFVHAQDPSSALEAQAAASTQPAAVTTAVVPPPALVAIPEPAAPPSWATDLLMNVSKLPVLGPYISKALLYLGILAAILTTLVGAALSVLASLQSAFKSAGLDGAAAAIAAFKNGKIMYWLTYFSNFNAQKKPIA